MNRIPEASFPAPQSFFWGCLTLSKECPFFSTSDPNLYYFGIVLASLYAALLLMIVVDLKFYWSVDHYQRQIDYYINLIRKNVRHVQQDQKRLMSQKERTEKQLRRSEECKGVVSGIRSAVTTDDYNQLSNLTSYFVETRPRCTWTATRRCHGAKEEDLGDWYL